MQSLPDSTMLGLSNVPSSTTRCSNSAANNACSVSAVTSKHRSIVCDAVHQHLGLDDRHDVGFLAQRRVTRERVGVDVDAVRARDVVADRDDRAPLREPGAESAVLVEPLAQTVETFGDELAGVRPASGFVPLSTLMPGITPCSVEHLHERAAVGRPTGGSSRRRGSRR